MILQILIAALLILMLTQIYKILRYIRVCYIYTKLPGPTSFPVIGFAIELAFIDETEMLEYFKQYIGNLRSASAVIWGRPYTLLRYPPDLERAMANSVHITKGLEYNTLMLWLNEGLLTSRGSKWHSRRKILTPTFHFKILEDCVPVMNDNAIKLINKLLSHNCQPVNVDNFITLCSLDIICEAAMGIKLHSQDNNSVDYVRDIKRACHLMTIREKTFYLRNNPLFRFTRAGRELSQVISRLHRFTEKVITDRKLSFKGSDLLEGKKRMAFLDCLLDTEMKNPGTFSSLDIREEVDTFMFEGHDTTSSAIVFALHLLGLNKDVQEKALKELLEIFGESNRPVTIKDLPNMKYLEMIIKETLRLYPSVPIMTRHLNTDLQLENGIVIPASTNLMIMPFLVHRDPTIYEDPEKFIPERFLEENSKMRHPFAYIPFSAGPRNCIGQKFAMLEMKVVLSTILRRSMIESVTTTESIKLKPLLILRSDIPIEIKFSARTN